MTNKVPHAAPLADNEGPANYVAGWNMPGYLPTSEPEFFVAFDDAKRYILNQMGEHADDAALGDDENTAGLLESARQFFNLEDRPFTTEPIGNVVYWVEKVD